MDEDVSQGPRLNLSEDNTRGPVRACTAPALPTTLSGLEAVLEEDEKNITGKTDDSDDERGQEADDEMQEDEKSTQVASRSKDKGYESPSRANSSCSRRHTPSGKVG